MNEEKLIRQLELERLATHPLPDPEERRRLTERDRQERRRQVLLEATRPKRRQYV